VILDPDDTESRLDSDEHPLKYVGVALFLLGFLVLIGGASELTHGLALLVAVVGIGLVSWVEPNLTWTFGMLGLVGAVAAYGGFDYGRTAMTAVGGVLLAVALFGLSAVYSATKN
jgi:hypothetical protein